jgi:acyl-CoA thioesterase
LRFDEDTALAPAGDGVWAATLTDTWEVVRGPLGGYVAAIVLRGLVLAVGDPARTPRSLTVHFLRPPVPGPALVHAQVERAGRALSTASARLEQDGRLCAIAIGAFAPPYPGPRYEDRPAPAVAPPDAERRAPQATERFAPPRFAQNLTIQPRLGAEPFSGAEEAVVGGWLGLLESRPLDALSLALLTDAWFPAPFPRLDGPAAAPTIDLTVHLRTGDPAALAAHDLVLARFTSTVAREGYFEEDGELWTPDGTLVAQSRQLALLLG